MESRKLPVPSQVEAAGGRWESSPSSAGWEIAMKGKGNKLGEREEA